MLSQNHSIFNSIYSMLMQIRCMTYYKISRSNEDTKEDEEKNEEITKK